MREVRKRKNSIKEAILRHLYDNIKLYLIVTIILVIGITVGVVFINNINVDGAEEIKNYITDFINNSGFVLNDFSTYITALKSSQFIVPVFNIILTIPFGAYLHYYFKFSFKRTVLWSFLLSLFFELTQVTGLYFIYPRGYRLFDVDDLILNTFGGFVGYFVGSLLLKFLPDREEIDDTAKALGRKVSIIRRSLAYCLDWFIATIIFVIINFLYIVFTGYKDSLMFAKFDTLKLSFNIGIFVTIYYLIIFILKNLYVKYSKKKLEIEK